MKKLLVLLLTVFALNSCEQDTTIIDATAEKKLPKVDVIHYDADTDTWKTLSISENALKAHLAHGDLEGSLEDRLTYVPDDGFEQFLILEGYDEAPLDDYVLTSNIINIKNLRIDGNDPEIFSLIGLEDFRALEDLSLINEIYLKDLDLSKNIDLIKLTISTATRITNLNISKNLKLTHLDIHEATVYNLDLTGNIALETLSLTEVGNNENLDLTNNIALKGISCLSMNFINLDLTKNIALEYINMHYGSVGSSLDLSQNKNLKTVRLIDISRLTSLNLKNGNYTEMAVDIYSNRSLNCVQVDNVAYSNANWLIRPPAYFSDDCGY